MSLRLSSIIQVYSESACLYSTTRVHVNCTDKFHTLRCRVVRCICTIFFRAWSKKKKNAWIMCLCYSVLQVSFVSCCLKQRTFRFEKAASQLRKIYVMSCYTHACCKLYCTFTKCKIFLQSKTVQLWCNSFCWCYLIIPWAQLFKGRSVLTQG